MYWEPCQTLDRFVKIISDLFSRYFSKRSILMRRYTWVFYADVYDLCLWHCNSAWFQRVAAINFSARPYYVRSTVKHLQIHFHPGRNEVTKYSFHSRLKLICESNFFLTGFESKIFIPGRMLICDTVLCDVWQGCKYFSDIKPNWLGFSKRLLTSYA